MTTTVWGTATQVGGIAAHHNRYGELTGAHSFRSLALELPPDGVTIDVDHGDQQIGRLVYAELGDDDAVRCVAVLDNDQLTRIERPVYFSPTLSMRGDVDKDIYIAREAAMIGLSVTLDPATLAASPIKWRTGDIRREPDRFGWPTTWRLSDPLLARAADQLDVGGLVGAERRAATRIVDQRPRRFPPLEPALPTRRPTIEHRSATLADLSASKRTIDVIVMPWERPTVVVHQGRRVHEVVSHGAFDTIDRDGGRVKVVRDHDPRRALGRAVSFDPRHPEGLWARLRIAKTRAGDEAIELANEQILDVSAGFGLLEGGELWPSRNVRRLTKLWLDHIALVSNPAYADARVLAVRDSRTTVTV